MDGLLGIGEAGGSSNKNEGKALANRLEEMRKARDERAAQLKQSKKKAKKQQPVGVGAGMNGMSNNMELDTSMFDSMDNGADMDGYVGGPPNPNGGSKKAKNNKKKKKKRKNRR